VVEYHARGPAFPFRCRQLLAARAQYPARPTQLEVAGRYSAHSRLNCSSVAAGLKALLGCPKPRSFAPMLPLFRL
jgi:hypothetical protein